MEGGLRLDGEGSAMIETERRQSASVGRMMQQDRVLAEKEQWGMVGRPAGAKTRRSGETRDRS